MNRRLHRALHLLLVPVCLLMATHSMAQDSTGPNASNEAMNRLKREWESGRYATDSGAGAETSGANLSQELLTEYQHYAMKNVQSVFTWHYYSSIMIFFLVVIIVVTGLYLSYRQFRLQEWKTMHPGNTVATAEKTADGITTLELGKDGLKMNSAVIGLIILSISLAFFFLYLKYVYPIQMLDVSMGQR